MRNDCVSVCYLFVRQQKRMVQDRFHFDPGR